MDEKKALQKLDYQFLEKFLQYDEEKKMFILEEQFDRFPIFYYEPEHRAIYLGSKESK